MRQLIDDIVEKFRDVVDQQRAGKVWWRKFFAAYLGNEPGQDLVSLLREHLR